MTSEQKKDLRWLAKKLHKFKVTDKEDLDMATFKREDCCGTSCCAIGWYCTWRPKDKLKLKKVSTDLSPLKVYLPMLRKESGFAAIALRFGLSDYETGNLFGAGNPDNPKIVAKQIDKFLDKVKVERTKRK